MTHEASGRVDAQSHNLALVSYGLLFAAIFFAGVPALIAAIIAYTQRDDAPASIRTHYDYQIKIFWVAFAMSMLAAACLLGAVVSGIAELVAYNRIEAFLDSENFNIDLSRVSVDGRIVGMLVAGALLIFLTTVWLVAAPAIGFIRLASARGIGHSPAT